MDWKFLFASFDGRISRQPFWIGFLVLMAANLLTNLVIRILFGFGAIGGLLSLIAALVLAYGAFAVLIKRCHDRGKSGWWSVLAVVPFVGLVWVIVDMGILEGAKGANQYGADPLEGLAAG
ncbi:MAG: DUF805 domain-containing protein [Rhodobiaceae bacterium]|nr:DUF805 domain-containing protein [Rhodobiaceae bacterium]